MKKLLSFLAVTAIVTSAFAFTNYKKWDTFCVKNATGTGCVLIQNKMEDYFFGDPFTHFPLGAGQWDGTFVGCAFASPGLDCITPINLTDN